MVRKKKKKRTTRRPVDGRPLLERIFRTSPLLAFAVLLTILFGHQGLLRKFETTALDTTMFLRTERKHHDVAIVRITDDDYKREFDGKSPLNVTKLQKVIDAIALGRPKLIGVDIDTSAPEFNSLRLQSSGIPIVFARNSVFSRVKRELVLADFLGGLNPPNASGTVLFKEDEDGAVRRYSRMTRTNAGEYPSFAWAIIKQLGIDKSKGLAESDEDLFINYVDTSASSTLVNWSTKDVIEQSSGEGYQTEGLLKDKIVLLGGDYQAQDEHDTPLRWMIGVSALSQIIETEIEGGGRKPASELALIVLQIVDGLVLVILFQVFRLHKALLISTLLVPLLALACSLMAFRSFASWAYFVPVLLLTVGHQLYEQLKEYFKRMPPKIAENLNAE